MRYTRMRQERISIWTWKYCIFTWLNGHRHYCEIYLDEIWIFDGDSILRVLVFHNVHGWMLDIPISPKVCIFLCLFVFLSYRCLTVDNRHIAKEIGATGDDKFGSNKKQTPPSKRKINTKHVWDWMVISRNCCRTRLAEAPKILTSLANFG